MHFLSGLQGLCWIEDLSPSSGEFTSHIPFILFSSLEAPPSFSFHINHLHNPFGSFVQACFAWFCQTCVFRFLLLWMRFHLCNVLFFVPTCFLSSIRQLAFHLFLSLQNLFLKTYTDVSAAQVSSVFACSFFGLWRIHLIFPRPSLSNPSLETCYSSDFFLHPFPPCLLSCCICA